MRNYNLAKCILRPQLSCHSVTIHAKHLKVCIYNVIYNRPENITAVTIGSAKEIEPVNLADLALVLTKHGTLSSIDATLTVEWRLLTNKKKKKTQITTDYRYH